MNKQAAPNGNAAPQANAQGELEDDTTTQQDPSNEGSPSERLLAESKKWKQRAIDAEKKVKERETQELEAQNKFKDLYEAERKKSSDLLKRTMMKDISSAVEKIAAKAGCIDPSALFQLGNADLLQYDEDSGEVHGVDTFVEDVKKSKPYLFQVKQGSPSINPTVPGGQGQKKMGNTPADILKLSQKEKAEVWGKLLNKQAKH